jgi:hypothetical protein
MFKLPLLLILGALLALTPAGAASAASNHKCASPKGTRAPTRNLHGGLETSCAKARQVAVKWDRQCEVYTGLCHFRVGGQQWSCRSSTYGQTHNAPPESLSWVDVKCGGKETSKGRPAVNFRQVNAIHPCKHPTGTDAQIRFLTGYYDAPCKVATPVAKGWDAACDPGEDGSSCSFSAAGDRWMCKQSGRPGVDAGYSYVCTSPGVGKGRPAVTFGVRIMPLPPGVPDPG